MFANLKKKIESEVGDLSRLTPNLRSVTQSDKMTPLSSRHGSVSSLASETSYTNKLTSPLSPTDSQQMFGAASGRGESGAGGSSGGAGGGKSDSNQRLKRLYEEKIQNQELDFAWRLNSKDDEITKLQKQVDHLNNMLQSKEFETQQKLVRVQEDMDSLEGFSQQENAKIKHLLLNREEEISQLRATVMMRDSEVGEFETQLKSITVENERLRKSLDEVVGRQGNLMNSAQQARSAEDEGLKKKLRALEDQVQVYEAEKQKIVMSSASKDLQIDKLQGEVQNIRQKAVMAAEALEKDKSQCLIAKDKVITDLQVKLEQLEEVSKHNDELRSKLEHVEDIRRKQAEADEKIVLLETEKENIAKSAASKDLQIEKLQEQLETEKENIAKSAASKDLQIEKLQEQLKTMEEEVKTIAGSLKQETVVREDEESAIMAEKLRGLEDQIQLYETEKQNLVKSSAGKDLQIVKLQGEVADIKQKALAAAETLEQNKSECLIEKERVIQNLQAKLQEEIQKSGELSRTIEDFEDVKRKQAEAHERIRTLETEKENVLMNAASKDLQLEKLREQLLTIQENFQATSLKQETSKALAEKELERLRVIEGEYKDLNVKYEEVKQEQIAAAEHLKEHKQKLKATLDSKTGIIEKLQAEVIRLREESRLSTDSVNQETSRLLAEHEERVKRLQLQVNGLSNVEKEKAILVQKLSAAEERIQNLLTLEDQTTLLRNEQESLAVTLESKVNQIEALEKEVQVLREEKELALEAVKNENSQAVEDQRKLNSELQSKLDELAHVEVENGELVLQISEIQSKCDEFEEENNFLKESANSEDYEALKRKVVELEADLLDRNQMLKQQSHQLQDLRRSLAKEINKNQAIIEGASASSSETVPQCNGSASQQQQPASVTTPSSASEPPTLPPQETDVNFMYLRSVIFKFLTTTDVQVTHQLTRVVATLLHLSEEETHLLSQATESRNGWVSHLIVKS